MERFQNEGSLYDIVVGCVEAFECDGSVVRAVEAVHEGINAHGRVHY